jgi:hypothetical protein
LKSWTRGSGELAGRPDRKIPPARGALVLDGNGIDERRGEVNPINPDVAFGLAMDGVAQELATTTQQVQGKGVPQTTEVHRPQFSQQAAASAHPQAGPGRSPPTSMAWYEPTK